MKKLVTLATIALVAVAQAASIDWTMKTATSTIKALDGSTDKMTGTAYLILASDLSSLDANGYDTVDDFIDAVEDIALGSASLSGGKNTAKQTATSDELTRNVEYDFKVIIYDSVNEKYYTSATKSQVAYQSGSDDPTSFSLTAAELGATNASTPNSNSSTAISAVKQGGTPGVPEPATGALALAGVALLFKRRRA